VPGHSGPHINDPWLVRRPPALVGGAGFAEARLRSHGFVQTTAPDYMLSVAGRGADALATGLIGPELAEALKAEAARRVRAGAFFGHIAYASLIAIKPG
jgi:hypothetical protein